ncbi:MAG: metal-dependent phosphohydrolase, partial [Firmicutes bacterium]|nr:metal-dependent phosphohydrolase [Bacillota bacterium]
FLRETELFAEEEIEQIAAAVKNHSNKSEVGTPLEEIVKDADVLDFHQYGYEMPRKEQQDRLERMLKG